MTLSREAAIRKITEMPTDRVSKVLIFMAGMEAEHTIDGKSETMAAGEAIAAAGAGKVPG